jgi:hypothetical protein
MTPYNLVDRYSFTLKVEAAELYIRTLVGLSVYKTTQHHIPEHLCTWVMLKVTKSSHTKCWTPMTPKRFFTNFHKLASREVIFVTVTTVCSMLSSENFLCDKYLTILHIYGFNIFL